MRPRFWSVRYSATGISPASIQRSHSAALASRIPGRWLMLKTAFEFLDSHYSAGQSTFAVAPDTLNRRLLPQHRPYAGVQLRKSAVVFREAVSSDGARNVRKRSRLSIDCEVYVLRCQIYPWV
jgi:hypothetical protein